MKADEVSVSRELRQDYPRYKDSKTCKTGILTGEKSDNSLYKTISKLKFTVFIKKSMVLSNKLDTVSIKRRKKHQIEISI